MDIEYSQPRALEVAACRVDVKAGLGLRRGHREKPDLLISELHVMVLDTNHGKMGLYLQNTEAASSGSDPGSLCVL